MDTVTLEGLEIGTNYKLSGWQMVKAENEKLLIDGKEVTMQVKEGQKVIYSKYAGTNVEIDDEEYIIVKQDDILAICE